MKMGRVDVAHACKFIDAGRNRSNTVVEFQQDFLLFNKMNVFPVYSSSFFYFLKKDIKVTYILAGIILFGILGAAISMF